MNSGGSRSGRVERICPSFAKVGPSSSSAWRRFRARSRIGTSAAPRSRKPYLATTRPISAARPSSRSSPATLLTESPRRRRLPLGGVQLRRRLTPLAARCSPAPCNSHCDLRPRTTSGARRCLGDSAPALSPEEPALLLRLLLDPLPGVHDHDRPARAVRNAVRDVAQQELLAPAHAHVADHDHIHVLG